jgi:hypothetical protein
LAKHLHAFLISLIILDVITITVPHYTIYISQDNLYYCMSVSASGFPVVTFEDVSSPKLVKCLVFPVQCACPDHHLLSFLFKSLQGIIRKWNSLVHELKSFPTAQNIILVKRLLPFSVPQQ